MIRSCPANAAIVTPLARNAWNIGPRQNNGAPQRDCFILRRDGTIEGAIDWDCFMPAKVIIDGLLINDSHPPQDYQGPYLFPDPNGGNSSATEQPFPYQLTEQVTIGHLTTASGKKTLSSPDAAFNAHVQLLEAN